MNLLLFLFWLAAVAGVIAWAGVTQQVNPRRHNLEAWAEHNDWSYRWDGHSWLPFLAKHLGTKLGAEALAVVDGVWEGAEFAVFEHWYFERGAPTQKQVLTVAVAPLAYSTPVLQFLPRKSATTLTEIEGEDLPIDNEALDVRYRVRTADPDHAMRVLGPWVFDDVAGIADQPFLVTGTDVVVWAPGAMSPQKAEDLASAATWLAGLLDEAMQTQPELA